MRAIEAAGRAAPAAGAEGGERGFGEALRRAGGRAARADRPDGTERPDRAGQAGPRREADRAGPERALRGGRRGASGNGEAPEAARGPWGDGAGAAAPAWETGDPQPAAVELAPIVRALPVAIAAARIPDGSPLTLSFGRSVDVELRAGAAGVEIVLRPEARLLAAAEAELPRILAALRGRGIAVGRAQVRSRGGVPPSRSSPATPGPRSGTGGEPR